MVEQNGGKFRRQKNHKKIAFGRNQKNFSRNVSFLMCRVGYENKKKFVMGTLNLTKRARKNNFVGRLGSENFIRC